MRTPSCGPADQRHFVFLHRVPVSLGVLLQGRDAIVLEPQQPLQGEAK
jgi:hypothetical protein